jgi:hypothetical protein
MTAVKTVMPKEWIYDDGDSGTGANKRENI